MSDDLCAGCGSPRPGRAACTAYRLRKSKTEVWNPIPSDTQPSPAKPSPLHEVRRIYDNDFFGEESLVSWNEQVSHTYSTHYIYIYT